MAYVLINACSAVGIRVDKAYLLIYPGPRQPNTSLGCSTISIPCFQAGLVHQHSLGSILTQGTAILFRGWLPSFEPGRTLVPDPIISLCFACRLSSLIPTFLASLDY